MEGLQMMKRIRINNNLENRLIGFKYVIFILISILTVSFTMITPTYALSNESIKWSEEGNTYRLTPADNTITETEYTIKAIEFPSPVRGYKSINGSVNPENPVTPFIRLELYKDIINNTSPVDTFTIGIGDEFITSDQEMRITINDIPGSTSQDWVYEYYNPWVTIKTQKRSIPNLDIAIDLSYKSGSTMDEDNIRSGENIEAEVRIKNTGDDVLKNVEFDIDPGQLLLNNVAATIKLKDSIYQLNKDEEKVIDVSLIIPVSLEEKEYEIRVDVTGHDAKDVVYSFNTSKIIKTKGDIEAIYIEKVVSKNTSYLNEYVGVALNVVNTGHTAINNIQIHDAIPERLVIIKNGVIQNYTEFSQNRSSLGPSESWTIDYSLKAPEPGIYLLPQFDANFSIGGKNLSATSSEVAFRVFGPYVILTKSATDMGNGVVEVTVNAKNIGNGPTKVIVEDRLPDNTILISGSMNLSAYLDPDSEKVMDYTLKASDTNISNVIWPPAKATYYLDDWKFNTSSDEKYEGGHRVEEGYQLEEGSKVHVIVSTPAATLAVFPEAAISKIEEEQKQIVATIPAKTSIPPQEKKFPVPGFESYELLLSISIVISLLRKKMAKK